MPGPLAHGGSDGWSVSFLIILAARVGEEDRRAQKIAHAAVAAIAFNHNSAADHTPEAVCRGRSAAGISARTNDSGWDRKEQCPLFAQDVSTAVRCRSSVPTLTLLIMVPLC